MSTAMGEIVFYCTIFVRLINLVSCEDVGSLVPDRQKLEKQPIGIKMCEQQCELFSGCVTYCFTPSSLLCSTGGSPDKETKQKDTLVFKLPKPRACRLQRDCGGVSVIVVNRNGRCICVQNRRREQLPNSMTKNTTSLGLSSRDLKLSNSLETACQHLYEICGQNEKKTAKAYLKQLCRTGEGDENQRKIGIIIRIYVQQGRCDLSKSIGSFGNILHTAANNGFPDVVKCVLSRGKMDIDTEEGRRRTPILISVMKNNVATFKVLLQAGARLDVADIAGKTVLHYACESADIDIVTAILEKGVRLDSRSKSGKTPVMYAIRRKNLEIFSLMVQGVCDVGVRDTKGMTLLHRAAMVGADAIVKYILSENLVEKESTDYLGRTPIFIAVYTGQSQSFEALIEYKCVLDKTDKMNNTLLHVACKSGNEEIVTKLLDLGFGSDLKKMNANMETPLQLVEDRQGSLGQMLERFVENM